MQKKIIASLLMSPLAINALANVEIGAVNNESWVTSGVTGDQILFQNGVVTCPIGTGVITQTIKAECPGTYLIKFGSVSNAVFSVVSGAEVVEETETSISFKVTKAGDVTIQVAAKDAAEAYSFSGGTIEIVYDFAEANANMQAALDKISIETITAKGEKAEALAKDAEPLQAKLDAIAADIAKVVEPGSIDLYKEYELYNTPNKIEAAIDALTPEIEALNEKISAENDRYATVQANTAAKAALVEGLTAMQDEFNQLTEAIGKASEYVQGQCKEGVDAVTAALKGYGEAIETAYADLEVKDITFEPDPDADAIKASIAELQAKYDQSVANDEAWTALEGMRKPLDAAYQAAQIEITGFEGIKGYEDAFGTKQAEWMNAVAQIKDDAEKALAETNPDNAAENAAANKETIDNAVAAINAAVAADKSIVDGQNELMTAAVAELDQINKDFAEQQAAFEAANENLTIDPAVQAEFNEKVQAVADQIQKATDAIVATYKATELTEEYYKEQLASIDEVNADLNNFLADQNLDNKIEAQNALQKLIAHIEEGQKDLGVNILSKFQGTNGTIPSIQAAINALTGSNADVLKAINEAEANADVMIASFKAAHEAYVDFDAAINRYAPIVSGKQIESGSKFDAAAYNTNLKAFQNLDKKWGEDYNAAAAANAQECYKLADALAKEISEYGWQAKINTEFNNFEDGATQGNYDVAVAKLAAVKDNTEASFGTDAIDTEMADIQTKLTAALAAADFSDADAVKAKVEACAEVDAAVTAVIAKINKIADNQKLFVDFTKDCADLLEAIDKLNAFNEDNSVGDKAKAYFKNYIAENITAKVTALQTEIKTDLEGLKLVDNETAVKERIAGLNTLITNTETNILENEKGHAEDLVKSQEVRTFITDQIEILSEKDETIVADWLEQLSELRDKDLLNLDREVTAAYNEGKCKTLSPFGPKYDEIKAAAQQVMDEVNAQYGNKVAAHNQAVMTDAKWTETLNGLRGLYLSSISTFNAYKNIKNAGYKAFLEEKGVFTTHAALYDYSTAIRQLEAAVTAYIADADKNQVAVTPEQFAENATAKATDMTADMNKAVADMVAAFNTNGKAYYAQLEPEVEQALADTEAAIKEAGLEEAAEELVGNAKADLKKAQDAYADATAEGSKVEIGMEMDGISDSLDSALKNLDLQEISQAKWNAEYADATKTFNELKETLDGCQFADEDIMEAQKAIFEDNVGKAAQLNNTALADKDLLNSLKADLDLLEQYVNAAQAAVDQVKASNDGNVENQEAYKNYTETVIPGFNDEYDALVDFVNSLGGTTNVATNMVKSRINNLATLVEFWKSSLSAHQPVLDTRVESIKDAIASCYAEAYAAEILYLQNVLLSDAKVAYNNARVNNPDQPYTEENEAIDKLAAAVGEMALTPEDQAPEEFKTTALGYEADICAITQKLQEKYTPGADETTVSSVLAALDTMVEGVNSEIADAQTTLADYEQEVKDEYASQYEALQSKLDAVKSAYEEAGATVMAQEPVYIKQIEAVQAELEALNTEVDAAQVIAKQHAESNARYDELNAEYEALVADLDAFNKRVEEYGLDNDYSWVDQYINGLLESDKAALDAAKEAYALDENSALAHKATIEIALPYYTMEAMQTYARNSNSLALIDINNANNYVGAPDVHVVPAVRDEINSAINGLLNDQSALAQDIRNFNINEFLGSETDKEEFYNSSTTVLQGYIDSAKQLSADANALLEKAKDNTFYPGDLNGNDEGKVTVADVQILIEMIGQGETYANLYAEDPVLACAADMTGDEQLNVADVTAIIQLALNPDNNLGKAQYAMVRQTIQSSSTIDAVAVGEENGVRTYAIRLNNAEAFVAGQLDLCVAAGSEIVSVKGAGRLDAHEVHTFDNADNTRVVIASMENAEIDGNEGATLFVEVKGRGAVGIENVIFADQDSQTYSLEGTNPGTSGIDSIIESAKAVKEAIYDVAGRAVKKMQRGLNIIRNSDGTVTKEIRK